MFFCEILVESSIFKNVNLWSSGKEKETLSAVYKKKFEILVIGMFQSRKRETYKGIMKTYFMKMV